VVSKHLTVSATQAHPTRHFSERRCTDSVIAALEGYIAEHNRDPKPFILTAGWERQNGVAGRFMKYTRKNDELH
jgi:hypothetical protein